MTKLSPAILAFRQRVEDEASFPQTCDGGDPGTPERRSTWVMGIEPGWSLAGARPEDYRAFARRVRPFERGSAGYLKANLLPEPCNTIGEWDAASAAATGFATKDEYRAWLRANRFRVLKAWIERCRPR